MDNTDSNLNVSLSSKNDIQANPPPPADTTGPCHFLDLPPKLFKIVVENLPSDSAKCLRPCNKALSTNLTIWKQRMHTPLNLKDISLVWDDFRFFCQQYPEKAAWVRHLRVEYQNVLSSERSKTLDMFPNLKVVDLRDTRFGREQYRCISSYLYVHREIHRDPTREIAGILIERFMKIVNRREGVRYILGPLERVKNAENVVYEDYRIYTTEKWSEMAYEKSYGLEEAQWENCKDGETRVTLLARMKSVGNNESDQILLGMA